jgi:hypothetical protein
MGFLPSQSRRGFFSCGEAASKDAPTECETPRSRDTRPRLATAGRRSDGDADHRKLTELHDEIASLLLAAERQKINELFRSSKLKDEARRRVEGELDMREASLTNQRAGE